MSSENKQRVIKLPGQRLRNLATNSTQAAPIAFFPFDPFDDFDISIRIVSISDIHNTQPDLPQGDILIHAGDLTENRSPTK
jgi:hypothetical protein